MRAFPAYGPDLTPARLPGNPPTTFAAYFRSMTSPLLARLGSWMADVFLCDSVDQAAGAMADATRWGWLPALSGVVAGGDHARSAHLAAGLAAHQDRRAPAGDSAGDPATDGGA